MIRFVSFYIFVFSQPLFLPDLPFFPVNLDTKSCLIGSALKTDWILELWAIQICLHFISAWQNCDCCRFWPCQSISRRQLSFASNVSNPIAFFTLENKPSFISWYFSIANARITTSDYPRKTPCSQEKADCGRIPVLDGTRDDERCATFSCLNW